MSTIKEGRLNVRLSANRLNKLRAYAESREKTVTSIVEDWIDKLTTKTKEKEIDQ